MKLRLDLLKHLTDQDILEEVLANNHANLENVSLSASIMPVPCCSTSRKVFLMNKSPSVRLATYRLTTRFFPNSSV